MARGDKGQSRLSQDLRLLQAEVLAGLQDESSEEEEEDLGRESPKDLKHGAGARSVLQGAARVTKGSVKCVPKGGLSAIAEEIELTVPGLLAAASQGSSEPVERIEDVFQLLFRDCGLKSLATPRTVDFFLLSGSLEVLSLSHNLLTDIRPLSALASLLEVNVNFNQIVDLSPLFDCELLEKLFAANNRITSIAGLDVGCRKLFEISLFANCLADRDETRHALQGLEGLRRLDIGQNPCFSSPAERYKLIEALPQLEVLDRRSLGVADRKLARGFFEAKENDAAPASASHAAVAAEASVASPMATSMKEESVGKFRPDTAPAACWRPPPLPGRSGPSSSPLAAAAGGASGAIVVPFSLGPLPGQKLKSARANRMDELLTQPREPSPAPDVSRRSRKESGDPLVTLQILKAHSESLRRKLETLQMERENLRFQVRLMERDIEEAQPAWLKERVERLELECRSSQAVLSERDQLQSQLQEIERSLAALDVEQAARDAPGGGTASAALVVEADEDVLEDAQMEGKMLEKRLERSQRYVEKLQQEYLRAQLKSSHMKAVVACDQAALGNPGSQVDNSASDGLDDPEVVALLAANEAGLRQLQGELRDTATAMARQPTGQRRKNPPVEQQDGSVDVLKIGEGSTGQDVEWHSMLR